MYKKKAKLIEQAVVPVVWAMLVSTPQLGDGELPPASLSLGSAGSSNPHAMQRAALTKLCKSLAFQMGDNELAVALQQQQTVAAAKGFSQSAALLHVPALVRQLVSS